MTSKMITVEELRKVKEGDTLKFKGWDGEFSIAKVEDVFFIDGHISIEMGDYEETIITEDNFKELEVEVVEND